MSEYGFASTSDEEVQRQNDVIPFTVADREMLHECYLILTSLRSAIAGIGDNPMAANMLKSMTRIDVRELSKSMEA